MLVFVSPEIARGEVRAAAAVYPVVLGFWDRLRASSSEPAVRAVARRPLDGEVREVQPAQPQAFA